MLRHARTGLKRAPAAILAGVVAATLSLVASAAAAPRLEVAQAWSRPAAAGGVGAGYMTLRNHGRTAETLTAVDTPAAGRVEIHRSVAGGGMMSMRAEPSIVVPAGGAARFEPGGLHLMLIGLKHRLAKGDRVPAVLTFASGARLKTEFVVAIAAPSPSPR